MQNHSEKPLTQFRKFAATFTVGFNNSNNKITTNKISNQIGFKGGSVIQKQMHVKNRRRNSQVDNKNKQINNQILMRRTLQKRNQNFQQLCEDVSVLDNYKMMSHIGKGCFSTVSLAVHKNTNINYAVKIYEKIDILQTHRVQNIIREIKHLKKLKHDNVIQLLCVIKDKKKLMLLMENGGKQSLMGLLRKSHFFTQERAKFYFKQIVHAVRYCHSKGICHRDLKPQNILVNDQNSIKIIDFGFSAKSYGQLNTFCGTPPFMCPQIAKKIPYNGAQADIWALGVILYLLVTGTVPFKATNQTQLFRLIQQGKYPVLDGMSRNLRGILSKMLNVDVFKRATAQNLVNDPWLQ